MKKNLLVTAMVISVVLISGMAMAYQPGIDPSTGAAAPQYLSQPEVSIILAPYNPGIDQNGCASAPSKIEVTVTTDHGQYNPGIDQNGMPVAPK